MKQVEAVMATTHIDLQGERMDREGLESLAKNFSSAYIPVGIEHDPRIPPQGRVASGFVRERPDGEHEVVGIIELFEGGDEFSSSEDTRELKIKRHDFDGLVISHDWTHRFPEDQADIAEIANAFGSKPVYEVKKSAHPISVITITGASIIGAITAGFFQQIGIDTWNVVKKRLANLFSRTESRQGEQLLVFRVVLSMDGYDIEVEAILTNPTPDDVDSFLESGLQKMDKIASRVIEQLPSARRIVFESCEDGVEFKFVVLKDCRALRPTAQKEAN